jgi:preprotein translocase subunit SecB
LFPPGQLQSVYLSAVSFEENPDFDFDEGAEQVRYRIDSTCAIYDVHRAEALDETHANAHVSAEVVWLRDDEPVDTDTPFSLSLTLTACFSWPDITVDEDTARKWLDYNALYLLWPYLRMHIAEITGMSRMPKLTIYTMNVPESPDFEDTDENVLGASGAPSESRGLGESIP